MPAVSTAVEARAPAGMAHVPGGTFAMGCDRFYTEEAPVRHVAVDGFWMNRHPVTVREFAGSSPRPGYVTLAERRAGIAIPSCTSPSRTRGRMPPGPARRFRLEAEWERAARGGLEGALFAWGDEFAPGGRMRANTWQGEFPWQNLRTDGYEGTSPVSTFPPNGYGLYDMTGNVWEWTADFFSLPDRHAARSACCAPTNPRVREPETDEPIPRRVIKGGSHRARRTTACATGPPHDRARPWTRPLRRSASAASCAKSLHQPRTGSEPPT